MTPIDQLQTYLLTAIERVQSEKLRTVSDALRESIPEVVSALTAVIKDSNATPGQRLQSCELLLSVWQRVVKHELRSGAITARREQAAATKAQAVAEQVIARAAEKQASLKISAAQKAISRKLNRMEKRSDGGSCEQKRIASCN